MAVDGKIPNSSISPYATVQELVDRIDWRFIADLLLDDNTRAAAKTDLTDDSTESYARILEALRSASGFIEMSATRGGRYKPEDLQELALLQVIPEAQGGNGTNTAYMVGGDILKYMTCWLAAKFLFIRRFPTAKKDEMEIFEMLEELLKDLREGEQIFPFLLTQQAGLPSVVDMTTGQAAQTFNSVTQQAYRFFGPYGSRREY